MSTISGGQLGRVSRPAGARGHRAAGHEAADRGRPVPRHAVRQADPAPRRRERARPEQSRSGPGGFHVVRAGPMRGGRDRQSGGSGAPGFTVTAAARCGAIRSRASSRASRRVDVRLAGGVEGLTRLPALRRLVPHLRVGRAARAARCPGLGRRQLPGPDRPREHCARGELPELLADRADRRPRGGGREVADRRPAAPARRRPGGRPAARVRPPRGHAAPARCPRELATARLVRRDRHADAARGAGRGRVVVVPATLLGWLLGAVAALALAEATDTPPGAVVSRSVASVTAIELMLAVAVLGTLVLYLGSRARAVAIGGLTISIADVAAAGALVAVLVAFAVGGADAQSLASSEGTGIVLMLLPGLIALVAAVVIARVLQPVLRACERAAAGRSLSLKLACSRSRALRDGHGRDRLRQRQRRARGLRGRLPSTLIRNDSDRAAFEVPSTTRSSRTRGSSRMRDARRLRVRRALQRRAGDRFQGEAPSLDRRAVTSSASRRTISRDSTGATTSRPSPERARASHRRASGQAPGHEGFRRAHASSGFR